MQFAFDGDATKNPELIPPLALAYVGDAVLELYVRLYLVNLGQHRVNVLHKKAIKFVNATAQAALLRALTDTLTEEELAVAMRGRNAKSGHVPKNTDMIDYRYSTGLETLIGYLFLKGQSARIQKIFDLLRQMVETEAEAGE